MNFTSLRGGVTAPEGTVHRLARRERERRQRQKRLLVARLALGTVAGVFVGCAAVEATVGATSWWEIAGNVAAFVAGALFMWLACLYGGGD